MLDRRSFLHGTAAGLAGLLAPAPVRAQKSDVVATGKHNPALQSFDDLMISFVSEHNVPGASLAVTRHGKLVYARGFGFADLEKKEPVKPDALFRIASVSKPITSAAIMHLVEKGKIKLETPAFEYLDFKPLRDKNSKPDGRLKEITVQHLLHHTAGFDRAKSFDPMFRPVEIARAFGAQPPARPELIIRYMMGRPLDFAPGERDAYSNFGYCVLGRIIEKASGKTYEEFVKKEILAPLGIRHTQIGKTLPEGRAQGEVKYYDTKRRTGNAIMGPMFGMSVPFPYGCWYLEAMDSHGGWISSAIDLVRFASAFDDPAKSKILSAASIKSIFGRPPGDAGLEDGKPRAAYYGDGWMVRPVGDTGKANTWHTGLLDGTSTILVRRLDGLNWAVLFNTQFDDNGKTLAGEIDGPVHQAADKVKNWPNIDLFK